MSVIRRPDSRTCNLRKRSFSVDELLSKRLAVPAKVTTDSLEPDSSAWYNISFLNLIYIVTTDIIIVGNICFIHKWAYMNVELFYSVCIVNHK